MTDQPTSKANAAHYVWGGDCDGWRLVDQPSLSIIHERMPPGRSEQRHRHAEARQYFFVLTGTLSLEVGGTRHVLGRETGLEIAPGTPHQALNECAEPVVISQPTTRGDRSPA